MCFLLLVFRKHLNSHGVTECLKVQFSYLSEVSGYRLEKGKPFSEQ